MRTKEDVYAWTDAETDNVLAVMAQAAAGCAHDVVAGLAAAFAFPLYDLGRWSDQLALFTTAVRSAECAESLAYQAVAYSDRGFARSRLGHLDEAVSDLRRSLDAYIRVGNHSLAATQFDGLGGAYRRLGRFEESISHYRQAIDLFVEHGTPYLRGVTMSNLGVAYQHAGRHEDAIDAHTRAIALLRDSGDLLATAAALGNLAEDHRLAGDPRRAVARYEEALALNLREGRADTYWTAEHLWGLGLALHHLGEEDEARARWRRSAGVLHSLGLIGPAERDEIMAADVPETPDIIKRQL
jgi:tetratricopeptide (TPR) repeat protein